MFQAHPESGARLLANIPRLEEVAEIIRSQQRTGEEPALLEHCRQGADLLHLALALDRRIYQGIAPAAALAELKLSGRFDSGMLAALANYSPVKAAFELRHLPLRELGAGMAVDHDVCSENGNLLILKEGTVLTDIWIERLKNFAKSWDPQELVGVRLPRIAGVRMSDDFGRVPANGTREV